MTTHFDIAGTRIGAGSPTYIIAEVAQTHDGSLGTAHAYIDAAKKAGANAIKFQTHIADAESTPGEPFRVKFSKQDASRYDYWKRMEFLPEQWAGLAEHARDVGITFLSSPFSLQAIELLERVGMPAWKVGSGEILNPQMIDRMARTTKPLLFSNGMVTWTEADAAVSLAKKHGAPFAFFQCRTAYPCTPEQVGLNVIAELRERYACAVGLSDHSGTVFAGLAAISLGANLVEVHVTMSREAFGPDVLASITTNELATLVQGARFIEASLSHPINKDEAAKELERERMIFTKSVVAARDLAEGHVLTEADLVLKKPGTGIPATRFQEVVGKSLARAVVRDTFLTDQDLK